MSCLVLTCMASETLASPGEAQARLAVRNLAVHGPEMQESQLRLLISEHPANETLLFRLGNLLAKQQRWSEAQLAYRQASELAFDQPDIQYNLAVTLDHLDQYKMARHHYRLALRAASTRPHHFSQEAARQRLQHLGGSER